VKRVTRVALFALVFAALAAGPAFGADAGDEEIRFNRAIKDSVDNFRILRTDQKSEMNDYVTRVFELKNARCMEVVPYVIQAVRAEGGSARTLKYVDPKTKKERNFIQVVCPKFQVPGVEELIKTFDLAGVTSSPGDTRFFYRMQHRNAAAVRTMLRATELSGEGSSAIDAPTNTLYFRDSSSDFGRDLAVVKFMDVPVPQVEFDVVVYEIDKRVESNLGLYWDAWKNMLTGGVAGAYGSIARGVGADGFQSIVAVGGPAVAQFLNYLKENGKAKVITSTRLSVQNGEIAEISSLKRIPFLAYNTMDLNNVPVLGNTGWAVRQEQSDAPNAPGGNNVRSDTDPGTVFGEKSEGIYLAVTPTIGTQTLSARIIVTVNSLVGYTDLSAPIITERRTETTATLTPGKVFTLGGMDKETAVKETRGIPGLKDIPGLKYLFSYETDVVRKTTLVITIKPKIKNQLLYKALSLGWKTAPESIPADSVVFDQSSIVKPNESAHTDVEALEAGFNANKPKLKWGHSEWGTK
jgi:type II secretory pathway component GspD/PulD (secretin)